jgi:hypothetical protein
MSKNEGRDAINAIAVISDCFPGVFLNWLNGCPTEIIIPAEFPKSNYDVANGVAKILDYFGWNAKLCADDL